MPDSWDAFGYMSYVRARWRFVALSCAVALGLAGVVSLIQQPRYTATARILIEPPAGADPRSAMAVSPIYLESLQTYEHFAENDSLFQKALDQFQLRTLLGNKPIESLKKIVLKVGVVRNTRILEIAATLPDPQKAEALARFLAEQAVSLNRSLTAQNGTDLIAGLEQQQHDARAQLDRADAEWSRLLSAEPVDGLQSEIEQAASLRAELEQQAASANLEVADAADRLKQVPESQRGALRNEQSNAQARLAELRRQIDNLDRQTAQNEKTLAQRTARRERLDAERQADQAALTSVETRLRDTRNDLGYRGERLTIIDPGVVPEKPSSPNIPLNLAASLLLGLLFPAVWLALSLSYHEQRAGSRRGVLQALAQTRHD